MDSQIVCKIWRDSNPFLCILCASDMLRLDHSSNLFFLVPVHCEQKTRGQGFLHQLHLGKKMQKITASAEVRQQVPPAREGPRPMLGDLNQVKMHSPEGCSEGLPPFLFTGPS